MIFKSGTLFFKYKENHDKIKNAKRNPLSCLIMGIKLLGGLFLVQFQMETTLVQKRTKKLKLY